MTEYKNISKPVVTAHLWSEANLRMGTNAVLWSQYSSAVTKYADTLSFDSSYLSMPNGGHISFGSTQPKKMADAKKVFEKEAAKIEIVNPINLLHWFFSAEEVSKTFTGNVQEKVTALLDRIYEVMGYDKFIKHLKQSGYDPDNLIFAVNDCGFYLNNDYSDEPEFDISRHEVGIGAWPGVETGPIVDAQGGIRQFFISLNKMRMRMEEAGEEVDLTGVDHQTYMAFKLAPKREDIKIVQFSASVPVRLETKPTKDVLDSEILNSLYYIIPTDPSLPDKYKGKRAAEFVDDYMAMFGAESHALTAMLDYADVPRTLQQVFDKNNKLVLPTTYKIVTQHNGIDGDFSSVQEEKLLKNPKFKLVKDCYSVDAQGAYDRMTGEADAVIFGAHSPKITQDWDSHYLAMLDMFCTFIVNKQVSVEAFTGRPFSVISKPCYFSYNGKSNGALDWTNPEVESAFVDFMGSINPQEHPWGQMLNFLRYLHEAGFVKQEPSYLLDVYDPEDPQHIQKIKDQIERSYYDRIEPSDYLEETVGRDRTDLFEISVLGSAGTKVASYNDAAYEVGKFAAENGMHGRSGGGNMGVMGSFGRGFVEHLGDRSDAHYSAIQTKRTMQFEGCYPPFLDVMGLSNQYIRITPNFDLRMDDIFRSNSLCSMGGGIGTYQEDTRFLRRKEMGLIPEDKKMILLNNPTASGAGTINTFDVFLKMLPEKYHDDLIVVPDLDCCLDVIAEQKAMWDWNMKRDCTLDMNFLNRSP